MQVAMPVIAFKVWEFSLVEREQILKDPSPDSSFNRDILGVAVENISNFPAFISKNNLSSAPLYPEFRLTIPKIKLNDIKVLVNSNAFEETLAHLPGTALPGERGNVFITGHSSIFGLLPGGRKVAFFAGLPKVKMGDEVYLDVLGQRFVYIVSGIKIVDPRDVGVIYPPDNAGRYLTLMTCVPPGFNTKRLIVLAKLK